MDKRNRMEIYSNLIKEAEISKIAQENLDNSQQTNVDGNQIADNIFDKLLENIVNNIDSFT